MLAMNPLKSCTHAGIDFDPTPERTQSFTLPHHLLCLLHQRGEFFDSFSSCSIITREIATWDSNDPFVPSVNLCFSPGKKSKGDLQGTSVYMDAAEKHI